MKNLFIRILVCTFLGLMIVPLSAQTVRLQVNIEVTNEGPVVDPVDAKEIMEEVVDIFAEAPVNIEFCIRMVSGNLPSNSPNDYMILNVPAQGIQHCNIGFGCTQQGPFLNSVAEVPGGNFGVAVICHELGHCLGLPHTFKSNSGHGGLTVDPIDPYKIIFDEDPDFCFGIEDTGIDWNLDGFNPGKWEFTHLIGDCGSAHSGICANADSQSTDPDDTKDKIPCPIELQTPGGFFKGALAEFGPEAAAIILGDIVVADTPCSIPSNTSLSGNFAVIDISATCDFEGLTLDAQNAGAVGVIFCHDVANARPFEMPGSNPSINIPAVMISQGNCESVKNFPGEANLELFGCVTPHVIPLLFQLHDCSDNAISINDDPNNLFSFFQLDAAGNEVPITGTINTNVTRNFMSQNSFPFRDLNAPCPFEFTPDQMAKLNEHALAREATQTNS